MRFNQLPSKHLPFSLAVISTHQTWNYYKDFSRRKKKGFGVFLIEHQHQKAVLKIPNSIIIRQPETKRVLINNRRIDTEHRKKLVVEELVYLSWDKFRINAPLSFQIPNIHISEPNRYRITEYISGESLNALLQISAKKLETYHHQLCSLIEHFETRLAEISIKNTELYPRMPDIHDNKRFKQALPTLRKHLPGTLVESLAHFITQHQHPKPARLLANDINFFNLIIDRDGIWTLFDFELFAFSRNKESIALTLSPLLYNSNLLERGLVCLRDRYKDSVEYPSIRKTILSFLCSHLYVANLFVSGKWKSPRFPIEQELKRFTAIRHCLLNLAETL